MFFICSVNKKLLFNKKHVRIHVPLYGDRGLHSQYNNVYLVDICSCSYTVVSLAALNYRLLKFGYSSFHDITL